MAAAHTHSWQAQSRKKKILLLTYEPSLVPAGGAEVNSAVAGPISISHKEAAGKAFHLIVLKQSGVFAEPPPSDDEAASTDVPANGLPSSDSASNLNDQPPPGVNWKGSKKKQRKGKGANATDLYALLGLQNERWTATEQQIKLSYRKTCLTEHPDKKLIGINDESEKEKIEDHFKLIQEAYETLSDAAKRREYDSTDTFDDSLPSSCDPADFFKVFSPAFRRNSRWSLDTNVPDVGDETTPFADVDKFYNFWFKFRSWREFPHEDEEDVEGAESREHRRWIERNNSKLRERAKKDESKRLREFVENAYRLDPRVVRQKDEERLERERKKQEKEDAKRRVIEEARQKEAEAAASLAAAEAAEKEARAAAKVEREAAKKLLKRERQRLRSLMESSEGAPRVISEDQLERLTSKMDQGALQRLNSQLAEVEGDEARRHIASEQLDELDLAEADEARAKEASKRDAEVNLKDAAKREQAKKAEKMAEWNAEELRMLDKAVTKWPQGTAKRWEQVTAYIRTRTMDEVLLMVKTRKGASSTRMKAQEDWKSAQKKPAEFTATADARSCAFTDVEVNLSGGAVPPAAAAAVPAAPTPTPAAAAASSVPTPDTSKPAAAAPSEADPAAGASAAQASSAETTPPAAEGKPSGTGESASGTEQPASSTTSQKPVAGSSDWNEEQELALVAALKQFGKELSDRWEKVSSVVPGKNKAQCFKRFKELRDALRAKKAAAGGGAAGAEGED